MWNKKIIALKRTDSIELWYKDRQNHWDWSQWSVKIVIKDSQLRQSAQLIATLVVLFILKECYFRTHELPAMCIAFTCKMHVKSNHILYK